MFFAPPLPPSTPINAKRNIESCIKIENSNKKPYYAGTYIGSYINGRSDTKLNNMKSERLSISFNKSYESFINAGGSETIAQKSNELFMELSPKISQLSFNKCAVEMSSDILRYSLAFDNGYILLLTKPIKPEEESVDPNLVVFSLRKKNKILFNDFNNADNVVSFFLNYHFD